MKSDCEDSATLEEKGGEVLDYNYGDVVKSKIQWFEQLKYQALSPKPATDVWSCWSVPKHSSPGESDLKNQHGYPCGRENMTSPPNNNYGNVPTLNGFLANGHHRRSVQFEENLGEETIKKGESATRVKTPVAALSLELKARIDKSEAGSDGGPCSAEPVAPLKSGPGLLRSPMLVSQVGRGKVKEKVTEDLFERT